MSCSAQACITRIWVSVSLILLVPLLYTARLSAQTEISSEEESSLRLMMVEVEGHVRVETSAILSQLGSEVGATLTPEGVAEDIRSIFGMGFFSEVEARTVPFVGVGARSGDVKLVFKVVEKPAIVGITFQGFSEISSDDVLEKLRSKVFSIISEEHLIQDLRTIEQMHKEKGYFLAEASYLLQRQSSNEVHVEFRLVLGQRLHIGDVNVVGNQHFSDAQLLDLMLSQPYDRSEALVGSPYYLEAAQERDEQFLAYHYQDHGYAQVKVGTTLKELSRDQRSLDLTFYIEEGIQYDFGVVSFSGELLFSEAQLQEMVELPEGEVFRISQLRQALEDLATSYGDRGYAFADIHPETTFHPKERKVDIEWQIRRGKRAYFGGIDIIGNTKTRDNVIRRELSIGEGDLYSRTKLEESRLQVERLGFFESVKFVRKVDRKKDHILHYTIEVVEKSTGQIQASVGYTPGGYTDASWFGQGKYDEQNQGGEGWNLGLSATYSNAHNYGGKFHFSNPRVWNSLWSAGFSLEQRKQNVVVLGFDLLERRSSLNIFGGRTIYEKIRGSVGWEVSRTRQASDLYLSDNLRMSGDTFGVVFSLSRRDLDNYLDPTEGNMLRLSKRFVGGPLGGDYDYRELEVEGAYYHPILLSPDYKTHVKLSGEVAQLSSYYGSAPPFFQRYRLGGPFDLRGFAPNSISPRFVFWKSPFDYDEQAYYPKGGDRKLVLQIEYYLPLISKARIKALLFADAGRVYDNDESFTLKRLHADVGFGLRMITPLGPFRFEWAFPIEKGGVLGPYRFVFNVGY